MLVNEEPVNEELGGRHLAGDDLDWLMFGREMGPAEAAGALGIGQPALRDWALRGWIRFFRQNPQGAFIFCSDDVKDLLRLCEGFGRPSAVLIERRLKLLAEEREQAAPDQRAVGEIDILRPSPSRVANAFAGGRDGFTSDREFARQITELLPWAPRAARQQEGFLRRVVEHLSASGIDQFLRVGTGFPTSDPLHEIARAHHQESRFLYVDSDPVAAAHARALLASPGSTASAVLRAELSRPDSILDSAEAYEYLDLARPVALLVTAGLHRITHDQHALDVIAQLRDAVPVGSYLALSHPEIHAGDLSPDGPATPEQKALRRAVDLYAHHCEPVRPRTREEITRFFAGWKIENPRLVPPGAWTASGEIRPERLSSVPMLVGLGVKKMALPQTRVSWLMRRRTAA